MTRSFKTPFLTEATNVKVITRDDEANHLEAIVNDGLYLFERHGKGRYTVTREGGNTYEVALDDFDSSCTCKGFTGKRRLACCRHVVSCAALAKDRKVLDGFSIRQVE